MKCVASGSIFVWGCLSHWIRALKQIETDLGQSGLAVVNIALESTAYLNDHLQKHRYRYVVP